MSPYTRVSITMRAKMVTVVTHNKQKGGTRPPFLFQPLTTISGDGRAQHPAASL